MHDACLPQVFASRSVARGACENVWRIVEVNAGRQQTSESYCARPSGGGLRIFLRKAATGVRKVAARSGAQFAARTELPIDAKFASNKLNLKLI
ncbi:hypothetical protein M2171_006466 [Bradyrhizobium japonicum USDA 38]|uniref:hypothetical protein n=1 Tax=Bradyrhizobium japonicum TaxID=375 RepID=UPI0004270ABE|nr:hypothetical protein [Bradyrhizobium japonicum]MCS3897333.1 hypothetical protein [Bradyrhizobium japonicum USDA 38]MCS3949848.1 hypothetical protein [Bradyrhizobium japonicum]